VAKVQTPLHQLPADQQKLRGSLIMNGYNFTERVRKVLAMAREEATRLRHEYVGTEHILLGLVREGEGVAATVLQNLGVDLDELKVSIEEIVKRGKADAVGPDLPYTSRAKKVLELSMKQARELNHAYVGTEHLLLGLIDEEKGIAAQVLSTFGVTLDKAVVETVNILGSERAPSEQESSVKHRFGRRRESAGISGSAVSQRIRDVMREAEDVATECGANELKPIHVAIALVRNGEGVANAVLDRLNIDRPELIRALVSDAKEDDAELVSGVLLEIGNYMIAFQRSVESESRWNQSPPTTLHILIALLDNVKPVSKIFETQGVNAERVRAEARKISG
jgi:ATP-dependent Clp protease ATP-binding subunit ClpA